MPFGLQTIPNLHTLQNLLNGGLDLCYPPICPGCDAVSLNSSESSKAENVLCENCLAKIAPKIANACVRCSAPIGPYVKSETGCPACYKDRFGFDKIVSLGQYDNELRSAVLKGKTTAGQMLISALSQILVKREQTALEEFSPQFVVPVPRVWFRDFSRLDNSPLTMGQVLAKNLKIPLYDQLLKVQDYRPRQANLSRSDRLTNLKQAFKVSRPKRVKNGRVLLVDDVLTTGATANEAVRALQAAGAQTVMVVVLARSLGNNA